MDKCVNHFGSVVQGEGATAREGAPLAGVSRGPAKPALDLSLGHFGTTGEDSSTAVEDFGPFKIVFDLTTRTGVVVTDASAFHSRQERRAAEREFIKVAARIGHETGFAVSLEGKQ